MVVVVVLVVVDVVVVVVVVEFLSSGVSNCVTIFCAHLQKKKKTKMVQLVIPLQYNSYLSSFYCDIKVLEDWRVSEMLFLVEW